MQLLIDLIGASILAGLIILFVAQMNESVTDTAFQTTMVAATQANSKTIADIINYDFYKIGYHETINDLAPIVEVADSDEIRFRSDIDNNGSIDTVHYFTSDTPYEVPGSSAQFKKLYRSVNSAGGEGAALGLTSFKLSYYDTLGTLIALPTPTDSASLPKIKSIRIQMSLSNPVSVDTTVAASFDTTFAATYWEKFISPKNLRVLK